MAVHLENIGNTSLRLRFQGSVGGELRLDALLTLVVITLGNGRPLRIPDDLRGGWRSAARSTLRWWQRHRS